MRRRKLLATVAVTATTGCGWLGGGARGGTVRGEWVQQDGDIFDWVALRDVENSSLADCASEVCRAKESVTVGVTGRDVKRVEAAFEELPRNRSGPAEYGTAGYVRCADEGFAALQLVIQS